jgi:hypothetical protein
LNSAKFLAPKAPPAPEDTTTPPDVELANESLEKTSTLPGVGS